MDCGVIRASESAMTKRTDSEIAALSKDVDAVLSSHSKPSTVAPPLSAPVTLRMRFDVDPGNINTGAMARATIAANDGGGAWQSIISASATTAQDAAVEAVRQLDAAVAELRAGMTANSSPLA
jgi:ElaB/YqjD/DUF883 family membrane-anchored ribosome-binding protein